MQRKFERRVAAMLAVLAMSCPGMGLAQTQSVASPANTPDAVVAQMAAQLPPPTMASPPVAATPAPPPAQTVSAPTAQPQSPPQSPPQTPPQSPPQTPPQSPPMASVVGQAPQTPASVASSPPRQPMATASLSAPVGPGEVGADYILGSADKIRITVFGEPSLTGEYFVSSSGKVSLPLAGEVQAAGLTLRDFHDHVVKALQDGYLKDPKVSLEVLTFRPFYILGEVSKPGQYPYTSGLTVFNAVATAGGFTYRANTRKVLIKRASESAEREVPLSADTTIAPGDTIRIPERFF